MECNKNKAQEVKWTHCMPCRYLKEEGSKVSNMLLPNETVGRTNQSEDKK